MAQAFHISPSTSFAISICIAFAALTFPFFMKSLGQGLGSKTTLLSYATLLLGFYMAWNIGANDVANAMGTSVGSGALTLRQAVLTAAVLEFSGALLMGTHVTSTMQKGILVANVFQGKDTLLFAGLLSSLAAAGTWLQLVLFLVYKCIRRFVYSAPSPGRAAAAAAPIVVLVGVTIISFAAFPLSKGLPLAMAQALACGTIEPETKQGAFHNKNIGFLADIAGPKGTQLEIVNGIFGYMQVLSACLMSFADGGNDVANAIGPLAGALSILQGITTGGGSDIVIPCDVLAWGGFGIVAGPMMWGYRVIATVGKKITELTPTRGFAAASVVLFASKLGLPISATHTLVGAVMGVGFARGLNNVRAETVREIVASWAMTIPVSAFLAVFYTWILRKLLSYIL
ncbi:hypothetical protein F0562_033260 [Nyssa sinensis]|uniref:Phosphate transporter n=1 Tax=Nyssa sinensis TaxID=561372 RepID=A0A5J5AUT6_9ASTE|nr:hypothetical protein F0562_033260 [Nyssa sinensis]